VEFCVDADGGKNFTETVGKLMAAGLSGYKTMDAEELIKLCARDGDKLEKALAYIRSIEDKYSVKGEDVLAHVRSATG
jgi:hypothetical protein